MEESNQELNWPPLESDPQIFSDYFHSIGLKKDVKFYEMLSLIDYKEFISVGGPLLGVILNYSSTKEKENTDKNDIKIDNNVNYYMKQTKVLDNACGLIAALHIFGNAKIDYEDNSILSKYFEKAKTLNPLEKAKLLEEDKGFKKAHKSFSECGQTDIKDEIKRDSVGHYIAFIPFKDSIYLLDGLKEGPIKIEENKEKDFLSSVIDYILDKIKKGEIKEEVNVMLVYDNNSEFIDLLGDM